MRANRTRVIFFALNSGSYGLCARNAALRGDRPSTRMDAPPVPCVLQRRSLRALRQQRETGSTKPAQAASGGRRNVTQCNAWIGIA